MIHHKKKEFSDNERKLTKLLSEKPMKFKDLRPFFNSPTTLTKHLDSLNQRGTILKTSEGYEINPKWNERLKLENINDKIDVFIGNLDENTLSSEFLSKEKKLYTFALIDYPWEYFDNQKLYEKGGLFFNKDSLSEVRECAQSVKIEGDTISFKAPKMEKGKKFLYFICMEG